MKKLQKGWVIVLVAITAVVSACGGGGGGGGESSNPADAAYSGVRTEAYIVATNAEALVLGAYGGVDIGGITPLAIESPGATGVLTDQISDPFNLSIVFHQASALVRQDVQVNAQSLLDPAQECLNYPSGTLSDTLVETVSGTTDKVDGSINYNNCDIGGAILDGAVKISATINLLTDDLTLSMTMNPLDFDDGIMTFSLIGSISGTMTTNSSGFLVSHLTLNITLDDLTGKTFWLSNYVIDETEEINGMRSSVRGRFYENDYGFVDFVTDPSDTIFVPFNPSDSTYDGRIDFTGSSGSHATLWLGVNQSDYCINVFNSSGVVDLGTCVL